MDNSLEIGIIITALIYSIIVSYLTIKSVCVCDNDKHDEIDKL